MEDSFTPLYVAERLGLGKDSVRLVFAETIGERFSESFPLTRDQLAELFAVWAFKKKRVPEETRKRAISAWEEFSDYQRPGGSAGTSPSNAEQVPMPPAFVEPAARPAAKRRNYSAIKVDGVGRAVEAPAITATAPAQARHWFAALTSETGAEDKTLRKVRMALFSIIFVDAGMILFGSVLLFQWFGVLLSLMVWALLFGLQVIVDDERFGNASSAAMWGWFLLSAAATWLHQKSVYNILLHISGNGVSLAESTPGPTSWVVAALISLLSFFALYLKKQLSFDESWAKIVSGNNG